MNNNHNNHKSTTAAQDGTNHINNNNNNASSLSSSSSSLSMNRLIYLADEIVRYHKQLLIITNNNNSSTNHCKLCCITIMKLIDNIFKYNNTNHNNTEMYYKVRKINLFNKSIQQNIVNYPPKEFISSTSVSSSSTTALGNDHNNDYTNSIGIEFLLACGFIYMNQQNNNNDTTNTASTTSTMSISDAIDSNNTLLLIPKYENQQCLMKARQLLQSICIYELHCPTNELPVMPLEFSTTSTSSNQLNTTIPSTTSGSNSNNNFNPYQGYRIDMTGQNTNTSSNSNHSIIDLELQRLTNAQQKLENQIYNTNQNTSSSSSHEWTMTILSSSLFTTTNTTASTSITSIDNSNTNNNNTSNTNNDSALLASHLQKQALERQKRENIGFTTKAMRDIEKLKQTRIYTHVQLSIHITLLSSSTLPTTTDKNKKNDQSNSTIVQFIGKFLPRDTIQTVMDAICNDCFISSINNNNQCKNENGTYNFELYSTPPMTKYSNLHRTLNEEQLVPASKLFLRWTNNNNNTPTIAILQPQWLSLIQDNKNNKNQQEQQQQEQSFPKSIPIISAVATTTSTENENDSNKKKKTTTGVPPVKKISKEEALLKRMMGGGSKK